METSEQKNQFIYPITFEDFVGFRRKQSQAIVSNYSVKQFSKIRKLKKLLQQTQQKICNRIKLFKKASMDLQKKREKQNITHEHLQSIKKQSRIQQVKKQPPAQHSYMKSTKSSMCAIRIRNTNDFQRSEGNKKSQALLQQKIDHAKQIKMWKQRNKILVEQRRSKELREKVKSANIIRSHRNKAKQIKLQCEHDKFQEARKLKQQKFKEQIQKYDQLQNNLTKLQLEQREALFMWKQAMEES